MSGTSLDGVDVALIETDGAGYIKVCGASTFSYGDNFTQGLAAQLGKKEFDPALKSFEAQLTAYHADAVHDFLKQNNLSVDDIDVIGFHGQTIFHDPDNGVTFPVGDGRMLADAADIDVVNDFRSADVAAGGQGAPLVPLYHKALCADMAKPVAVLNIGGVANITYIGDTDDDLLAFDTGPGNALINDWIQYHGKGAYDDKGHYASCGDVDGRLIEDVVSGPLGTFFTKLPPKSLDRDMWSRSIVDGLSLEDGAATLTELTAQTIRLGLGHLPNCPDVVYVTGGGRHNHYMMMRLSEVTGKVMAPVEHLGWNGDSLEAEAFAYLAARSVLGKNLTLPSTTGVKTAVTGGVLHAKKASS